MIIGVDILRISPGYLFVHLSKIICTGLLSCLDGYMNIALEQTEEFVNGKVTNKYGDAFVRGNNGVLILIIN